MWAEDLGPCEGRAASRIRPPVEMKGSSWGETAKREGRGRVCCWPCAGRGLFLKPDGGGGGKETTFVPGAVHSLLPSLRRPACVGQRRGESLGRLIPPQSPTSISSSSLSEKSSVAARSDCETPGGEEDGLRAPARRAWAGWASGSSSGMLASFSRAEGGSFLSDSTSAFISSRSRFSLARRFWNQVMTCALLRPSCAAMRSRSAGDRYFW